MTITELIAALEALRAEHGDDVRCESFEPIGGSIVEFQKGFTPEESIIIIQCGLR
jgi:hypothetical protein